MALTRKHYERIAELTRENVPQLTTRANLVQAWIVFFKEDNPRFRPEQFVQACGLEMEDVGE